MVHLQLRPVLEYAAPVWQNIPDFLSYRIESIQKRAMRIIFPLMSYNEALNALNLTTLSDSRVHLCQVYIDRLRNENHPLHFMLPKQEEVVHNYNLRSGISFSTRPTCRTRGEANARSKIIIMHNLLLCGEHKMQGVILIPESININLA